MPTFSQKDCEPAAALELELLPGAPEAAAEFEQIRARARERASSAEELSLALALALALERRRAGAR